MDEANTIAFFWLVGIGFLPGVIASIRRIRFAGVTWVMGFVNIVALLALIGNTNRDSIVEWLFVIVILTAFVMAAWPKPRY